MVRRDCTRVGSVVSESLGKWGCDGLGGREESVDSRGEEVRRGRTGRSGMRLLERGVMTDMTGRVNGLIIPGCLLELDLLIQDYWWAVKYIVFMI